MSSIDLLEQHHLNIKLWNKKSLLICLGLSSESCPLNSRFLILQPTGPVVPPTTASFAVLIPYKIPSKASQAQSPFFLSSSLNLEFTSPSMDLSVLCHFWNCNCATRLGQKKNKENWFTWGGLFYCGVFSGSQSTEKCLNVAGSSGPATRLRGMGKRLFYLLSITTTPSRTSVKGVWDIEGELLFLKG